jgi:hypothetical protein
LKLIDNVRAILPPSTAADAGFSLEPDGYSIMTILNQRSALNALLGSSAPGRRWLADWGKHRRISPTHGKDLREALTP